MKGTICRNK